MISPQSKSTPSADRQSCLDMSYFKSAPAIVRYVELVLDLIVIICTANAPNLYYYELLYSLHLRSESCDGSNFMYFVSSSAFLTTIISLIVYVNIAKGFCKVVPFVFVEMIVCVVITVCYFIASCLTAFCASHISSVNNPILHISPAAHGAATFFGFVVTIVYGIDAFLQFRISKAGGYVPNSVEPLVIVQVTENPNA